MELKMDINEEIKNLTEAYQALLEGHNLSWVPLRALLKGKISQDKYDELNAKAQAIPSSNDIHKKEDGEWDTSNLTNKSISSVRSGELSTDKRHIENGRNKKELEIKRKNDENNGYTQATAKAKKKHKEKMNDNNSYNSITKQILDLTEAYANLLEAQDARGGAQKEVNKITRTKKDKNGEPIEVVSVADELFPYKGTAKEQYNQKILAKINDMIEGTATLEDLIQLIRQKKAVTMKESLEETLNQMMAVTEALTKSAQKWYDKVMDPETTPTGGMQLKVYTPEQAMKIAQGMSQMELDKKAAIKAMPKHKKNAEPKQQANQLGLFNDNNSLQETLDKMMAVTEEIILERNKENRAKKEKWELKTNHITKKEKKAVQDYAKEQGDEAKYHQIAADDYDHKIGRASCRERVSLAV